MNFEITKSANKIAKDTIIIVTMIVIVVVYVSFFEGNWSFFDSSTVSLKKFTNFTISTDLYLSIPF